jgi:hypothetical protein
MFIVRYIWVILSVLGFNFGKGTGWMGGLRHSRGSKPFAKEILGPHFDAFPVVKCWSNVKEEGKIVGRRSMAMAGIKIDDIPCANAAAVHHPVMPVKWSRITIERFQLKAAASKDDKEKQTQEASSTLLLDSSQWACP